MLRALAENAPTVMYAHVALAFDLLWHVLCAPSAHLRAAGGAALGACTRLVATRVSRQQEQWFNELLARARAALARDNSPHAWHGALLALEALLSCCPEPRPPAPSASDASAAASNQEFVSACFGVASDAATRTRTRTRTRTLALALAPALTLALTLTLTLRRCSTPRSGACGWRCDGRR